MSMEKIDAALARELEGLQKEGRSKAPERVIVGYAPAKGKIGPRYRLKGSEQEFIRMNSNSYLSLSDHPKLVEAADRATHEFGVGPGAVRFIDGTFSHHRKLEIAVAEYLGKPAAKIFNSAYTSNLGLALTLSSGRSFWIGDALNHNCIIRGMRIAGVPSQQRAIYAHNDLAELRQRLEAVPQGMERVLVIFDGIFSMRGDYAPLHEIQKLVAEYDERFSEGIITIVDDSHGIGAYGDRGRGTEDFTSAKADVVVGTFGKAFGVNGGFIAGSEQLIEAVRQKADTYIYTNPLGVADCAAALAAVELATSAEGQKRLKHLHARVAQFRRGVALLGIESIPGPHPVVPLLVRDTQKTRRWVSALFTKGVLVVGLTFPVVPRGDETIRVQINAAHTEADIDEVLRCLKETMPQE